MRMGSKVPLTKLASPLWLPQWHICVKTPNQLPVCSCPCRRCDWHCPASTPSLTSYLNTVKNSWLLYGAFSHFVEFNINKNFLWLSQLINQSFGDGVGLKSDKSWRGKYFCLKRQNFCLSAGKDFAPARCTYTTVICWHFRKISETLSDR